MIPGIGTSIECIDPLTCLMGVVHNHFYSKGLLILKQNVR